MTTTAQNFDRLEEYLDNKIVGKRSPGVQFLVMDSTGIKYEYNKGKANIENNDEVTSTTEFKMYSSTKLMTMLSIMQLVEKGKVELDAPLSEYLNYDFPKEITIRRVLSHTAGFTKYPFIKELHLDSEHGAFDYSEFIATELPKHQKLSYQPGTKNSYSNYGFLLLSAVVEKVSETPYQTYVKENIIKKAELSDSNNVGFEFTENTATAYEKRRTLMHWLFSMMVDTKKYYGVQHKDWQSYKDLYIDGVGFGGGFANARGLAELFMAVHKNKIVNGESLQSTFEVQTYKDGKKESKHALAWWRGNVNGHQSFHHAGGGGGYSVEVRYYPDLGTVRVMMMNTTQTIGDLKRFENIDKLWLEEK